MVQWLKEQVAGDQGGRPWNALPACSLDVGRVQNGQVELRMEAVKAVGRRE